MGRSRFLSVRRLIYMVLRRYAAATAAAAAAPPPPPPPQAYAVAHSHRCHLSPPSVASTCGHLSRHPSPAFAAAARLPSPPPSSPPMPQPPSSLPRPLRSR
eukprot:6667121-Prymnesium_polylepis.1